MSCGFLFVAEGSLLSLGLIKPGVLEDRCSVLGVAGSGAQQTDTGGLGFRMGL